MYSEDLAASRRCGLTEAQRGRFTQMLIDLEPSHTNIGDVMVWCLEHADSAADIADCVVESITSDTFGSSITRTPDRSDDQNESKASSGPSIVKLLARLFLISDILYNSSAKVPNASFFRKCFETRLPDVFKSMHMQYKNVEGKLKAEQLKQKVMLCFRAWEDWAVYPNDYLIKLQNIFLGLVSEVDEEADLAGVPLDMATLEMTEDKSSDGKRKLMDSDVEVLQAQPLVQYDGDPLDVDGSPLENDDVEDVPSRPSCSATDTKTNSSQATEAAPRLFVPSKWETVDPEIVESEAVTTMSRWELLVDPVPKQSLSPDSDGKKLHSPGPDRWSRDMDDDDLDGQPLTSLVAYDDEDAASTSDTDVNSMPATIPLPSASENRLRMNESSRISEERRNRLREIELKVLKYQDELESRRKGDKSVTEEAIAKQIQRYRERLVAKMNEDEMDSKQQAEAIISKSSKSTKERTKTDGSKRIRREHSVSPPTSTRDFRDRSPPRSFRDRPRRHPASPSATHMEAYNMSFDSPQSSTGHSRFNYDQDDEDNRHSARRSRIPSEELEEGEASDEEEPISQRIHSKRSHADGDRSPHNVRKRQRSRSPSPRSYRSRTPSPNRRRTGPSVGSTSQRRK